MLNTYFLDKFGDKPQMALRSQCTIRGTGVVDQHLPMP